jgi:hypothetical protein
MACLDHRYEPGAYGVCRRCGGERPTAANPIRPTSRKSPTPTRKEKA